MTVSHKNDGRSEVNIEEKSRRLYNACEKKTQRVNLAMIQIGHAIFNARDTPNQLTIPHCCERVFTK